jgi:hypothetical protein
MPGDRLGVPDSSVNDTFSEKSGKLLHDDHVEPKLGKHNVIKFAVGVLKLIVPCTSFLSENFFR